MLKFTLQIILSLMVVREIELSNLKNREEQQKILDRFPRHKMDVYGSNLKLQYPILEEQQLILDLHNNVRITESKNKQAKINLLSYNDELELIVGCHLRRYSSKADSNKMKFQNVTCGQNFQYYGSKYSGEASFENAFAKWLTSNSSDIMFERWRRKPYLQIIDSKINYVGCSKMVYSKGAIIACIYCPRANKQLPQRFRLKRRSDKLENRTETPVKTRYKKPKEQHNLKHGQEQQQQHKQHGHHKHKQINSTSSTTPKRYESRNEKPIETEDRSEETLATENRSEETVATEDRSEVTLATENRSEETLTTEKYEGNDYREYDSETGEDWWHYKRKDPSYEYGFGVPMENSMDDDAGQLSGSKSIHQNHVVLAFQKIVLLYLHVLFIIILV